MTFEEIDPRVIDTMRKLRREAEDAEYEASTVGADAWRDRVAQRHRFGRALDLPPVNREARGDWLIWLTLGGLVLWAIGAGVIWWLARSPGGSSNRAIPSSRWLLDCAPWSAASAPSRIAPILLA